MDPMDETGQTQIDTETQTVIKEARELTAQMIHTDDEDASDDKNTDTHEK